MADTENSIVETQGVPSVELLAEAVDTPVVEQDVEVFGMTETAVDKTLTISDCAADAKATGDAIANLAADISDISVELDKKIESVPDMTGATEQEAGEAGLAPAPAAGDQNKFLKADGTWSSVPDPQVMTGATAQEAGTSGLTPVPASGDQGKFLKGDGTWSNVPDPQIMTGATAQEAGTSGLTPVPAAGDQGKFLKGDGTWSEVPGSQVMTGATAQEAGTSGLTPAPAAGDQDKILAGDGTWKTYPGARIITVEGTISNTSGAYTGTFNDSRVAADMAPISFNVEDPSVFGGSVSVTTGAGFITITCSDISGESDFAVDLIKADFNGITVTTAEFDLLNALKLDKNQGSENSGKVLGIDSTGAVVPVQFSGEDFTGATSSAAGAHGYVPAPAAGDQTKFLKGDGTWSEAPSSQVMTGATSSSAGTSGLVPAPAIAEREMFLCGDGTWTMPEGGKLVSFDLDTVTNTSGSYTHTTVLADVTHDMKAVMIEVSNPDAFNDQIHVLTADGSVTLTCDDVAGTSDVTISCLFVANPSPITSSEFDVLANRIGTLASLQTTAKGDLVSAINETVGSISTINGKIGSVGSTDLQSQVDTLNSKITSDSGIQYIRNDGNNSYVQYRKIGNVVTVFTYHKVSSRSIEAWTNLIFPNNLPEGFRPPMIMATACVTDRASSTGCAMMISTSGQVYIAGRYAGASDTSDILQAAISYPAV